MVHTKTQVGLTRLERAVVEVLRAAAPDALSTTELARSAYAHAGVPLPRCWRQSLAQQLRTARAKLRPHGTTITQRNPRSGRGAWGLWAIEEVGDED